MGLPFPSLVSIHAPVPSATVWSHVSLSYPLIGLTCGMDGVQPTNYINPGHLINSPKDSSSGRIKRKEHFSPNFKLLQAFHLPKIFNFLVW